MYHVLDSDFIGKSFGEGHSLEVAEAESDISIKLLLQ